MENHLLVSQGFDILLNSLAPYVARELSREYGSDRWWQEGVLARLYEDQRRDLPTSGDWSYLIDSLDIARCLLLMDIQWRDVFRKCLSAGCKNYVMELKNTRNKWAHRGSQDFNTDDTWRALDTMSRLAHEIDPEAEAEINALVRTVRYGSKAGSVATQVSEVPQTPNSKRGHAQTIAAANLPAWRDLITPHPDVAEGRYRNAEFAADLAQVARGEGTLEYRDPVEFFNRTFVTQGMQGLLLQSLLRVAGKGGEPVIQLKTAFGGGKTHSMLALYHMMRSRRTKQKIEALRPILEAAGVTEIPEVHVAVLVGTSLNPASARRPADMPGIKINTLWGEIAYQLAKSVGKPALFDYVREADRKGTAPGSAALAALFDACGCALVLVDELVAYAKKLYGAEKLPAGSYDNFIVFVQELTEAARASKRSLVVASIPESEREIGGDSGKLALEAIEHTFGRMEAIWKPVAANEGFEVVRRRLFLECSKPDERDAVCAAFSKMYRENSADFPVEAKELEYRNRMIDCYPIHPEIFERLYEDWTTLEDFQRTRGVLRLMAAVIHELWISRDVSPLIMPGSLPLNVPNVRDELIRYLPQEWMAVVDAEVDGKNSLPLRNDTQNERYGKLMASRRVSRTVFLGSAPDVSAQSVRGIERARIRLGVVQPGESIATFTDALTNLQNSASYLYVDGQQNRFWFDTRPTLRKVMEDRALGIPDADADYEIEQRLRRLRKCSPFSGIHVCPASSLDVPDDQTLRLVVLAPSVSHKKGVTTSEALKRAADILENRGSSPRRYKNMLAFVACDSGARAKLKQAAKAFLAWKSIQDDSEVLNLDRAQDRETSQNLRRADETLNTGIREAMSWLLLPRIELDGNLTEMLWDVESIGGSSEDVVQKAAKNMLTYEAAITKWAPIHLRMELDRVLWKDVNHIGVKQLWDYLCTYCYLPRLAGFGVLEEAIRQGLSSSEYFGIADGVVEDDDATPGGVRYVNLSLGKDRASVNMSDVLVKPSVARVQLEWEKSQPTVQTGSESPGPESGPVPPEPVSSAPGPEPEPLPTTLTFEAPLDATRVNKDVYTIMDEIVSHLSSLDGAQLELSLEVRAEVKDGIPAATKRTVSENLHTLHIDNYKFGR